MPKKGLLQSWKVLLPQWQNYVIFAFILYVAIKFMYPIIKLILNIIKLINIISSKQK